MDQAVAVPCHPQVAVQSRLATLLLQCGETMAGVEALTLAVDQSATVAQEAEVLSQLVLRPYRTTQTEPRAVLAETVYLSTLMEAMLCMLRVVAVDVRQTHTELPVQVGAAAWGGLVPKDMSLLVLGQQTPVLEGAGVALMVQIMARQAPALTGWSSCSGAAPPATPGRSRPALSVPPGP